MLGVQFTDCPEWIPSSNVVFFPRLHYLSFTCANPIDARGLVSSVFLPHGVHLEVVGSRTTSHAPLLPFLPSYAQPIQKLLAPITTIRYQSTPGVIQLYGNNSCFSFRCSRFTVYPEPFLFTTAAVREFYTGPNPYNLAWPLRTFPELETLILVKILFSRPKHSIFWQRSRCCVPLSRP